jgi:hypothetical protein
MELVQATDPAHKKAAIHTIRELIDGGFAGLDCYDHEIFVVDAATPEQRDNADVALDVLGASFRQVGPFGSPAVRIECHLPRWVRAEFHLDEPGAPELIVPLASRAVIRREQLRELDPTASEATLAQAATLDVLIDDIARNGATV